MLRALASVGMEGKMYTPHFLKEFKSISAIGEDGDPNYIEARQGFAYQHPEPVIAAPSACECSARLTATL